MSISTAVTYAGHRLASLAADGSPTIPDFGGVRYMRNRVKMTWEGGDNKPLEIDASSLQLSLHIGDGFGAIISMMFRFIMEILWGIYSAGIRIVAWFADMAMGMGWLELVRGPFESIEDALAKIITTFNLYGVMLVVTAFVCAIWMARGKWAQGVVELLLALVIANYAVASIGGSADGPGDSTLDSGFSYSPINVLMGEQGTETGLIYQSRDTAQSILTSVKAEIDGAEDSDVATKPSHVIVETFLWYPLQLVNFGEILKPECQDAYAITIRTIQDRKDGDELEDRLDGAGLDKDIEGGGNPTDGVGSEAKYLDEGWKVPGACQHDDEDYYEDQANFTGLLTQFFLGPSVLCLAIVILVMSFFVMMAGINALGQGLKLIGSLLLAIFPGGPRRSLFITIGAAGASLLVVIFTIDMLGVGLIIINQVFVDSSSGGVWQRIGAFLLVDLLLFILLFMYFKGKKSVESTKEKVAEALGKLSPKGGGGGGGGAAAGGAFGGAAGAMGAAALMNRGLGGYERARGLNAGRLDHEEHLGRLAGVDGGSMTSALRPNQAARARRRYNRARSPLGRGMRVGRGLLGKVALGVATGGSSLLVQGGAMALRSRAVRAIGRGIGAMGRGVANRTIGRRSKLGNAARRGIVGTRNRIKQGFRGRVETRRQNVAAGRIARQQAKVRRLRAANPVSRRTSRAQADLTRRTAAERQRRNQRQAENLRRRAADLRSEAQLRYDRREELKRRRAGTIRSLFR